MWEISSPPAGPGVSPEGAVIPEQGLAVHAGPWKEKQRGYHGIGCQPSDLHVYLCTWGSSETRSVPRQTLVTVAGA